MAADIKEIGVDVGYRRAQQLKPQRRYAPFGVISRKLGTGATVPRDAGTGSAALLSFPLAVVGSSLMNVNELGIMCSGRRRRSQSRASASLGQPGTSTM